VKELEAKQGGGGGKAREGKKKGGGRISPETKKRGEVRGKGRGSLSLFYIGLRLSPLALFCLRRGKAEGKGGG